MLRPAEEELGRSESFLLSNRVEITTLKEHIAVVQACSKAVEEDSKGKGHVRF